MEEFNFCEAKWVPCPNCSEKTTKVIYFGFPMKLCTKCYTLFGFWSWIPVIHFNGAFMTYGGSYLKALINWLFGKF